MRLWKMNRQILIVILTVTISLYAYAGEVLQQNRRTYMIVDTSVKEF
jgi:hypothetical protein